MKILISPAKLLDYNKNIEVPSITKAHFLDSTEQLVKKLKKLSSKEISKLMNISESLGILNYERYQNWEKPNKASSTIKPAITVFDGEVYKGLEVDTFSQKDFEVAQRDLRILSGLYGILKPLDLIYPYRLEMGTKFAVDKNTKNLYEFWGTQIAEYLNQELKEGEVIINLASNEYFKAVHKKTLKARVITPVFKELREDGTLKVIVVYTKHARGALARDIIQNQYTDIEDIKGFNKGGYTFSEQESSENEWVFIR